MLFFGLEIVYSDAFLCVMPVTARY